MAAGDHEAISAALAAAGRSGKLVMKDMRLTKLPIDIVRMPSLVEVNLSGSRFEQIPSVLGSRCAINVQRLTLSNNLLASLEGLDQQGSSLQMLNVAGNQLTGALQAADFAGLSKLNVLNAGDNRLAGAQEGVFESLPLLNALILNKNEITAGSLPGLGLCTSLNTLVLSHNQRLEDLDALNALVRLPKLKKLSATNCGLRVFPDLRANHEMKELRLNSNLIVSCPADRVMSLGGLTILDVGSNQMRSVADLKAFAELRLVTNVCLAGMRMCDQPGYTDEVKALFPGLRVLDGIPCAEFKALKQKGRSFKLEDEERERAAARPGATIKPKRKRADQEEGYGEVKRTKASGTKVALGTGEEDDDASSVPAAAAGVHRAAEDEDNSDNGADNNGDGSGGDDDGMADSVLHGPGVKKKVGKLKKKKKKGKAMAGLHPEAANSEPTADPPAARQQVPKLGVAAPKASLQDKQEDSGVKYITKVKNESKLATKKGGGGKKKLRVADKKSGSAGFVALSSIDALGAVSTGGWD